MVDRADCQNCCELFTHNTDLQSAAIQRLRDNPLDKHTNELTARAYALLCRHPPSADLCDASCQLRGEEERIIFSAMGGCRYGMRSEHENAETCSVTDTLWGQQLVLPLLSSNSHLVSACGMKR
jgi:hypothetical protein